MIFKIEAAEKVMQDGQFVSGDTIAWQTKPTLAQAKQVGEKLLKRDDVFSVWIHKFNDSSGDPLGQWSKYDGSDWKSTTGW